MRGNHSEKKKILAEVIIKHALQLMNTLANLFIITFLELNLFRDTISWWDGNLRKTPLR